MSNENINYLKALAYAANRFHEQVENMLRNYFAQVAPEASLESLGRDRLVPRYPQESDLAGYRDRVVDAWAENIGRGNWPDIVRVVEGYGFTFVGVPDGFESGFGGGDPIDSFNILVSTLGGATHNGYQDVILALDVNNITWQSGNTIRYTFSGSPDLSGVANGDVLIVTGATNPSNNGTFLITAVSDPSDYVDVTNLGRSDATDDETGSPAVADIKDNNHGGAFLHNATNANEVRIEIKRNTGDPVPDATKEDIIAALENILRASINLIGIDEIFV